MASYVHKYKIDSELAVGFPSWRIDIITDTLSLIPRDIFFLIRSDADWKHYASKNAPNCWDR